MPINISTSSAIFRWRPACWLRVSGADAEIFLQGQFSNDLRGRPASGAVYGLWLTLKGKVLADSFVVRGKVANEFWVGSYFSPAAVIVARLEGLIIADDVIIEDMTADWRGVSLIGEKAKIETKTIKGGPGFVFSGRRVRQENWELIFPAAELEPAWIAAAGVEVSREEIERQRFIAGVPAIPADIGPADLPNEGGLDTEAISYTKGCYLGQEVMARLKSMGQVRRRLLRVKGSGATWPALPAGVFAGERQIGELRSAVSDGEGGWIGFAMLARLHAAKGMELAFAPGGPACLQLIDSP